MRFENIVLSESEKSPGGIIFTLNGFSVAEDTAYQTFTEYTWEDFFKWAQQTFSPTESWVHPPKHLIVIDAWFKETMTKAIHRFLEEAKPDSPSGGQG